MTAPQCLHSHRCSCPPSDEESNEEFELVNDVEASEGETEELPKPPEEEEMGPPTLGLPGPPDPPPLSIQGAHPPTPPFPSIAAYLAAQQADVVAKTIRKGGNMEENVFKEQHMRPIIRLIMHEAVISGGKTPENGISGSTAAYCAKLSSTANPKMINWLTKGSQKWTKIANLAVRNLQGIDMALDEKDTILSALHATNNKQKHLIAGLDLRLAELFEQVQGLLADKCKRIPKKDPLHTELVWDWPEVVQYLIKIKGYSPGANAALPFQYRADHLNAMARLAKEHKGVMKIIEDLQGSSDTTRSDVSGLKRALKRANEGACSDTNVKTILQKMRPLIGAVI
jgi:hypothetical protein